MGPVTVVTVWSLRTLTPTLSRFAVEGASECDRSGGVPSTAKRERDRVRVCGSVEGYLPGATVGPPAFFQASMPPSMWQAAAMPAPWAACTAMAERSPKAQ